MPHLSPLRAVLLCMLAAASAANLHAAVNILNAGAKGDCKTDDAPAINAAIQAIANSTTHEGNIYFPQAPGGCYLVDEPIVLPGEVSFTVNNVITLAGDGQGVTIIRAGAAIETVLEKNVVYNTGDTVVDITFDANALAQHAILIRGGAGLHFTRIEGLNGLADDFNSTIPTTIYGGGFTVNDSNFINLKTFPPYNIYLVNTSDSEFTNNVSQNGRIANIAESGGGSNHFVGNHVFGYPRQYCPTYSFVAEFTSIWIGNQSDCSNEAAILVNNWQAQIQNNFIQGAANHAICLTPKAGNVLVQGNEMGFAKTNAPTDNAIVQGVIENGQVSCAGEAVHTSTWGNPLNYGATNFVLGNSPSSNENLWAGLYMGKVNQTAAIGIGTPAPQATLDVNGFARLSVNSSEPAVCQETLLYRNAFVRNLPFATTDVSMCRIRTGTATLKVSWVEIQPRYGISAAHPIAWTAREFLPSLLPR